jgi:hypothetical protein
MGNKKYRLINWVAINLKKSILGSKNVKFEHWKKWTVRDFFGQIFIIFAPISVYTDLSKNRPHKKHCAWAPTPPPGEKWIFIEISRFLLILGPSIEPEKPSVKSASTPYPPPQNDHFIAFLYLIVTFRVLSVLSCLSCMLGIVFSSSIFWYSDGMLLWVFLVFFVSFLVFFFSLLFDFGPRSYRKEPQ